MSERAVRPRASSVEFRAPRARDRDGDDVIDHSPASTLRVRRGTAADAAVLARHRADMFRDIGRLDAATYAPLLLASTEYFARAIPTGEYVAWIATTGDATETPVAGAGVQVRTLLPRPNETGMYRLTLIDSPEIALRILKAIGRRVAPSMSAATG